MPRARLGVALAPISQADLDAAGLEYGVRIQRVLPGSVAEQAGLQAGDVVTAFDDRPAYSPERLQHLVNAAQAKATVALTRDGEGLKFPLDLATTGETAAGCRGSGAVR